MILTCCGNLVCKEHLDKKIQKGNTNFECKICTKKLIFNKFEFSKKQKSSGKF